MTPSPGSRLDRDPEFRLAVARLRVALARYRLHQAFDEAVRQADVEPEEKTDPRAPAPRRFEPPAS